MKGDYFTSTGTLQKFPVLYICQAQRPLNVVFDKSNWQDKQSKTSSLSESCTPFKKENVLYGFLKEVRLIPDSTLKPQGAFREGTDTTAGQTHLQIH